MTKVVLQRHFSLYPGIAARAHADHLIIASIDDIVHLQKSGWMPVGSVEFCLAAMVHQGITPPEVSTYPGYPEPLRGFLRRKIWAGSVAGVMANGRRVFVKPSYRQKLFTGFVWPDEDGQEIALKDLPELEVLWCSEPVNFVQEWRFYVMNGEVIGAGRYDDGEDPDMEAKLHHAAREMVKQYRDAPAGYSIDIGVLDTGQVALVEVNDGWGSLGFYKGSCSLAEYFSLLVTRWDEIVGPFVAEDELVKNLRALASEQNDDLSLAEEAADEIQQLRKKIKVLESYLGDSDSCRADR
ncbi:MAG: ATP-grasp domain-containing protein [Acidithiobacillus sp.]|nr:ATP-grasp domain-containing protein [Acidithiobacillus sp.]